MRVKVLGSAAGGGFPQWNCVCSNCQRVRADKFRGRPRSQTQLAFTTNDRIWFLLSASPDLRAQILAASELCPKIDRGSSISNATSSPESPIGGVFLPGADVDSVAGLLHLREFQSFFIFATPGVQRILQKENRIFRVLDRGRPTREVGPAVQQGPPRLSPSTRNPALRRNFFALQSRWVAHIPSTSVKNCLARCPPRRPLRALRSIRATTHLLCSIYPRRH